MSEYSTFASIGFSDDNTSSAELDPPLDLSEEATPTLAAHRLLELQPAGWVHKSFGLRPASPGQSVSRYPYIEHSSDYALSAAEVVGNPGLVGIEFRHILLSKGHDANVVAMVDTIGNLRQVEQRAEIQRRLKEVLDDYESPDEAFTTQALSAFRDFLRQHPSLPTPSIGATAKREVYVRWKRSDRDLLSLWFRSSQHVTYVHFNGKALESATVKLAELARRVDIGGTVSRIRG